MADKAVAPNTNTLKPLNWPPIAVDVRVRPEQMARMHERTETIFHALGETDAHWSVLSTDRYRADKIGEHREQFFASGAIPVDHLIAALARAGRSPDQFSACLELGCGVGRSTVWLAEYFQSVIAADISAPHLRLAEQETLERGIDNVSFIKVGGVRSIESAPPFDLFFSMIVLQHNPPPVIHAMLAAAFDRLPTGGMAYFQVPTYRRGYSFNVETYLASPVKTNDAEMHVLPQRELHDLIARSDCRIVEMREDSAAGGDNISNRILLRKL